MVLILLCTKQGVEQVNQIVWDDMVAYFCSNMQSELQYHYIACRHICMKRAAECHHKNTNCKRREMKLRLLGLSQYLDYFKYMYVNHIVKRIDKWSRECKLIKSDQSSSL